MIRRRWWLYTRHHKNGLSRNVVQVCCVKMSWTPMPQSSISPPSIVFPLHLPQSLPTKLVSWRCIILFYECTTQRKLEKVSRFMRERERERNRGVKSGGGSYSHSSHLFSFSPPLFKLETLKSVTCTALWTESHSTLLARGLHIDCMLLEHCYPKTFALVKVLYSSIGYSDVLWC